MNTHNHTFNEFELSLPRQVDVEIAGDIEKESVFVSPFIDRIFVNADGLTARVVTRPGADPVEIKEKASRFLEVMVKQVSGFEIKVFVDTKRKDTGPYHVGVNDELVKRGWMHDYGKGQVAYSGPVLKLAHFINEKSGQLYKAVFDAKDSHFPAMIDADTLHKCGYFDSHPNAVTFVGNVIEDFDAIEEAPIVKPAQGDRIGRIELQARSALCRQIAVEKLFVWPLTRYSKTLNIHGFPLSVWLCFPLSVWLCFPLSVWHGLR